MATTLPVTVRIARFFLGVALAFLIIFLTYGGVLSLQGRGEFVRLDGYFAMLVVAGLLGGGMAGLTKRRRWGWWTSMVGLGVLAVGGGARMIFVLATHPTPSLFLRGVILWTFLILPPLTLLWAGRRRFFEAAH